MPVLEIHGQAQGPPHPHTPLHFGRQSKNGNAGILLEFQCHVCICQVWSPCRNSFALKFHWLDHSSRESDAYFHITRNWLVPEDGHFLPPVTLTSCYDSTSFSKQAKGHNPPPPLHTHTHTTPPLRKLNCNSPDSSPLTVSLPFVPWLYGLSLPIYFSPPFDDGLGNLTYVALQEVNINDITRRLKWVCSPWFALLYLCHRHEKSVSKVTAGSRGEEEAHGE